MRPDPGELRTPEELATLYELEPEIRDIIVEGRSDEQTFRWYTSATRPEGLVRVYAVSDRVHLPDADLLEHGLLTGERSRVLHLSQRATRLGVHDRSLRLVIDADFLSLGLDTDAENGYLLRTDYSSLEAYAFNDATIGKLLTMGLGAPERVTAQGLIGAIRPVLIALFLVRACLRESGTGAGVPGKAAERMYTGRHDIDAAVEEVLRLALDRVPRADRGPTVKTALMKRYQELVPQVRGDARHFINGHDISELLVQYLKAECKNVFNHEARRAFQAPAVMESFLMAHLDRAQLESQPLFAAIEKWIAAAG
ncbi:hypothetical protein [Kitasatospora sp. NPDC058046]|uniref:hypothetical protein n=1 Tax=Kitasatospora sp. NPDC058046 TaxID=3346312 RepID=UPI0036D86ACB